MHTQPVNVEYHCLSSKEKAKSYSHTERNISKEQWEKGTNNLLMLDPSNLNKILKEGLQLTRTCDSIYKTISISKKRCKELKIDYQVQQPCNFIKHGDDNCR